MAGANPFALNVLNCCKFTAEKSIQNLFVSLQMDMHELIEEQMKRQLEDSQRKSKTTAVTTAPPKQTYSHLLMRLFQR